MVLYFMLCGVQYDDTSSKNSINFLISVRQHAETSVGLLKVTCHIQQWWLLKRRHQADQRVKLGKII
jgi:hypothetical protein